MECELNDDVLGRNVYCDVVLIVLVWGIRGSKPWCVRISLVPLAVFASITVCKDRQLPVTGKQFGMYDVAEGGRSPFL